MTTFNQGQVNMSEKRPKLPKVPKQRAWKRALPFISTGFILVMVIVAIIAIVRGDTGYNGGNIFLLVLGLVSLGLRGAVAVSVHRWKRIARDSAGHTASREAQGPE